jgi:DNA helicase II / ATP-dependent DNA helicase PcrA
MSTIYRWDDQTGKVRHLPDVPAFGRPAASAPRNRRRAARPEDGRSIPARHAPPPRDHPAGAARCYVRPAPRDRVARALGSKSAFDAVADGNRDLSRQIFAIGTGLSGDPAMNWTCSSVDDYRLATSSAAHSTRRPERGPARSAQRPISSRGRRPRTCSAARAAVEFYPDDDRHYLDGRRKYGVHFTAA